MNSGIQKWRNKQTESLRFEYWPAVLVYLPAILYWTVLAIRSRALLYMTAANPGIEMGGFFGESKKAILDQVPPAFKPRTILIQPDEKNLEHLIKSSDMTFPLIAKPNVGERGNGVEKLDKLSALQNFLKKQKEGYILQEYSEYPFEYGVLFYRFPGETYGRVISVTGKRFMRLEGDSTSCLRDLLKANYRYSRQISRLEKRMDLSRIPEKGETVFPDPIGNHSRGTEFTNENLIICEEMHHLFYQIAVQMDGFYIGRFDVKAKSPESLKTGIGLHILEVNGTTSEPGHIYSQGYGIKKAYRDIFYMMRLVQQIGVRNHEQGIAYTPVTEFIRKLKRHFFPAGNTNTREHVLPEPVFH